MHRLIASLGLVVSVSGCFDPGHEAAGRSGLPPLVERVGALDYHSAQEPLFCADAPARVDQHLHRLAQVLPSRGPNAVTYVFDPRGDWSGSHPCPTGASGCTVGSTVYSQRPVHPHELTHAWLSPFENAPTLLREGVSTALGFNAVTLPQDPPKLRTMLAVASHHELSVHEKATDASGGLFVAHLLREYGTEAFLDFYGMLPSHTDERAFADAFEQVFGTDVHRQWRRAHEARAPYYCEGQPDTLSMSSHEAKARLGQGQLAVSSANDAANCFDGGPARHFWSIGGQNHSPAALPPGSQRPSSRQPSARVGMALSTNYRSTTLYGCTPGFGSRHLYGNAEGIDTAFVAEVPPGRYLASRRAHSHLTEAQQYLEVQQGRFFSASSCSADAEPYLLDDRTEALRLSLRAGRSVAIRLGKAHARGFLVFEGDLAAGWQICQGCGPEGSCSAITEGNLVVLQPGTNFISVAPSTSKRSPAPGADAQLQLGLMLNTIFAESN